MNEEQPGGREQLRQSQLSSQQPRQQEGPSNLSVRFEIALTDGDDPMVASRMKADGQPVEMPYVLILGGRLVLMDGLDTPGIRSYYAQLLQSAAQRLAVQVIEEARAAAGELPQQVAPPSSSPQESGA